MLSCALTFALHERSLWARARATKLFISIHHDSMQPPYLRPWTHNGVARRYSEKFRGYSIFISEQIAAVVTSRRTPEVLGPGLLDRGLSPTLHHAEPIAGENRELLDPALGIYHFP